MRVIVIGAGLLGLSTAHALRQSGADVLVIDRQSGPARETSFANGAMLHASQANPWNEPGIAWAVLKTLGREDSAVLLRPRALPGLARWGLAFVRHSRPHRYLRNFERNAHLARYSLSCMAALRTETGIAYSHAARGTLKLFRTAPELTAAARLCGQLADWGIRHELVEARRAAAIEPALTAVLPDLAGGLHFPDDESGDAFLFCARLADWLQQRGLALRLGVTAQRLRPARGHGWEVETDQGILAAEAIVLAAGSYSAALARPLGLYVPVAPVKGYSLTVPRGGWPDGPQVPVIDDHLHAAVCPLGDQLRVAGTAEFAGFDLALTRGRLDNLFELLLKLYPGFAPHLNRAAALRWAGLRPMSVDGVGIMGATPRPGLFLNTGHGHLGWTMAAGAGRLVAAEVLGLTPELPLAPYRLARFTGA